MAEFGRALFVYNIPVTTIRPSTGYRNCFDLTDYYGFGKNSTPALVRNRARMLTIVFSKDSRKELWIGTLSLLRIFFAKGL